MNPCLEAAQLVCQYCKHTGYCRTQNNTFYRVFSTIHYRGCSQQYIIEGVLNNTFYRVFSTIYYCKGLFSNILYSVYLTKHCTRCFIVQGVFNKTLYRVFYCTRCLQRKTVRGVILHRVSLTIYCKGRCFAPNFSAFCTECP